jgi:putative transposase
MSDRTRGLDGTKDADRPEQLALDWTVPHPIAVKKTYRFRVYPTKRQAQLLTEQLFECCRLYNAALQERRDAYRKCGIGLSCYDQTYQLKDIRQDGSTGIISFKVAQDVLQRVDRAFEGFFRRLKAGQKPGYPRFKSARRYDSMTYINYGKTPHVDKQGKLILKGIGHLKVRWHRAIIGTTKTCTIKREAGRWYVSFSTEAEADPLPLSAEVTGVDVGLDAFATLSDGTTIENPRYLQRAQARLRRAQRRVARRTRGSHRRRKAVQMLQRAHAHVAQQRRYFHHGEARKLVNRFGLIAVEDLQIQHLVRSATGTVDQPGTRVRQKAGLNREILSAAWGMFVIILFSKAAEAGRIGVKVNARGTSQRCPCGADVPKQLKDRWHLCPTCGLSVPRDQASALEIQRLALQQLSA